MSAQKNDRKTILSDDWSRNWQASIAVKITAVVMWVIIPFGFIIALLFINNVEQDVRVSIEDDAEIILNSARILLSENNSFYSPVVQEKLAEKLKKSVYCKIKLVTGSNEPIMIQSGKCLKPAQTIDTKYYFGTMVNKKPQELALVLSHLPVRNIMLEYRANIILIMIFIVLILGFILTWVLRFLVLRPLLNIVDATRLISEGQHELRLDMHQQDEFDHLARFLNKLLDQLFEQQKNLKQANHELMKEVAERNRIALELGANQDQLENLIEKRTADLEVARDEALKANQAKTLFLANMSHEIRTPLNAILGYAQLLNRDKKLNKRHRKSLAIIEESGNHLLGVLNDILDISKIEAGMMELHKVNFDLYQLLQKISQIFQERCADKGLGWYDEFNFNDAVLVHSDPQKLRQILINLIGNAIKFTDQGGISLLVKRLVNDQYHFEISDTGPGIDKDRMAMIFTSFHQEQAGIDKGGTGLGLTITRSQLQLLGSELLVESSPAQGSTFSFTLTLELAQGGVEIMHDSNTEVIRLSSSDSVKALVVDDSELSRNLLVDMLVEINATVSSANNGLEAVNYVEQQSAEDKPDIIFMDIRMPIMNGIDAARKIKKKYGDQIVCVAVTANVIEQPDNSDYQLGFDDYIFKPYRFEAVFECMKKHLHIDFEHEMRTDQESSEEIDIDFSQCLIEQDLYTELLAAAVDYNPPHLKYLIDQLAQKGDEQIKAAKKLRRLMAQYDIHAMVTLVKKLRPGELNND